MENLQPPQPSLGKFIALLLIGLGLVSAGVMFIFVQQRQSASLENLSAIPAEVNYPAPNLSLTDLSGGPVSLDVYRGKVVLVNLWATWCPPCRQEMPALQAFYKKYKDKNFELIAIDQEEPLETIAPFADEFHLTFTIWLDPGYQAQQEFHTINLPSSYVIDRNGQVRLLWIGAISAKRLDQYVPQIILE